MCKVDHPCTFAEKKWSRQICGAVPANTMEAIVSTALWHLLVVTKGSVKIFQPVEPDDCVVESNDDLNAPVFRARSETRPR